MLDSCRVLQDEGFDVTYLPVQGNGLVDLAQLEAAIRPDTVLVSIMAVNNEIGVIQPLEEIGRIVRKHKGVFFHTDAAQAVGKIPIDVERMNIDLMSLSSHKVYGPKGLGAAFVRRRPRVRIEPIISGGGQERGLRSGTVPAPPVVGFGEACRIAKVEMAVSLRFVVGVSFDDCRKRSREAAKGTSVAALGLCPSALRWVTICARALMRLTYHRNLLRGSMLMCACFFGAERPPTRLPTVAATARQDQRALHQHHPQRRPVRLPGLPQPLLRIHRRRIPLDGDEGRRAVVWQRLHFGLVGTELRVAGVGC